MPDDASSDPQKDEQQTTRWTLLRDVLVLQCKLLIGNVHNFVLMPLTLVAAALDLVFKSGERGSRFYRVLDWGRQAEEAIGLYRALDHRANIDGKPRAEIVSDDKAPLPEDTRDRTGDKGASVSE